MHRKHFLTAVLSTAVAVILATGSASELSAQSKKKSSTRKSSTTSKSKSKTAKAKPAAGRLPTYYGQIDLKPEQRDEIYSIQGKYKDKIEDLQKELDALKAKQSKDIEGVLTSTQKKKLASLKKAGGSSTKSSSKSKSKTKSKK